MLITALDIGSSQVKGIVGETRRDGNISVISVFKHPSAGIKKGSIIDVHDATTLFRDVAIDLQRISKKATQNVFVNINDEHVKSRPSRGLVAVARADQEIQADDVERALQGSRAIKLSPNHMILHNIVKEHFIDDIGDITDPVGMTGSRLEIETLIVESFAPKTNLLLKTLHRAGVRVGGIIFNPLAAARSVLNKRQKDLGVLMIDFGAGTTSFIVYEDNKAVFAKSLPIGAEHLTTDVAIGLKTSVDVAYRVKVMYGCALSRDVSRKDKVLLSEIDSAAKGEASRRFLSEIIEVRLAEILDLVNNELKSLGRVIQLPGGVVATGGGVKLSGLADLIEKELNRPAKMGLPDLQRFEITSPAHEELLDDPEFSVAAGLILFAADEKKQGGGSGGVKKFLRNLMP